MKLEDIEIIAGPGDSSFKALRRLEVKCEATNALMPAPTIDEANGRLRALAAKIGANAIVEVEYKSGVSFTSWKSLKATGVAGTKLSDEVQCSVCAETIKRAALKCRFCGAETATVPFEQGSPQLAVSPQVVSPPSEEEPLRDNNNPAVIVGLVGFGLFLLTLFVSMAGK